LCHRFWQLSNFTTQKESPKDHQPRTKGGICNIINLLQPKQLFQLLALLAAHATPKPRKIRLAGGGAGLSFGDFK